MTDVMDNVQPLYGQPKAGAPEADGAALLNDVHAFLGRFIAYPSDHTYIAHVLWIAHTHLIACVYTALEVGLRLVPNISSSDWKRGRRSLNATFWTDVASGKAVITPSKKQIDSRLVSRQPIEADAFFRSLATR